ncbi:MAG: hypothetical protein QF574_08465, partial [Arenicellales bacterium]|nr:hypothetical protein [Arenicellales bacterium]
KQHERLWEAGDDRIIVLIRAAPILNPPWYRLSLIIPLPVVIPDGRKMARRSGINYDDSFWPGFLWLCRHRKLMLK